VFFDTFKMLCDKKGVSPKKAVTEIGLSNSLATKWKKTGATPQGETLSKIAEYFRVSVDSLLLDVTICEDCEFLYSPKVPSDVKKHFERHEQWEKAKKKFGIWNKSEREERYEYEQMEQDRSLSLTDRIKAAENRIFAYFSRSVVHSDFDISHISFKEYIPYFLGSQMSSFTPDVYRKLVEKYGTKFGMRGTDWKPEEKKVPILQKIKPVFPQKNEFNITFDDFTYALHNEAQELTDENKQKLLEMARLFKLSQDQEKK